MKTLLLVCLIFFCAAYAETKDKEILPVIDLCPVGFVNGADLNAAVSKNEINPKRVGSLLKTDRRSFLQDEDEFRDCLKKTAMESIASARKVNKITIDQADKFIQRIHAILDILNTPMERNRAGLPTVSPKVLPASDDSSDAPATAPRGS